MPRKKKVEDEIEKNEVENIPEEEFIPPEGETPLEEGTVPEEEISNDGEPITDVLIEGETSEDENTEAEAGEAAKVVKTKKTAKPKVKKKVLTIDTDTVIETPESQEELIWHEIQNAYRSRRILTGTIGGVERTAGKKLLVIAYYKDFRVVIPVSEMMINLQENANYSQWELMERQERIINNMLGSEIDFIIRGIKNEGRIIAASRKSAMLKKRERFYLRKDTTGLPQVHVGRVVQGRIVAISQLSIRVDVFGVEASIHTTDLSWDWIGDAAEKYTVGERILVKILEIKGDTPETLSVRADVKSLTPNVAKDNLSKCVVQSKYVGTVTNINKGVVYIQLKNGVNAVAHACFDNRMPGRKDEVSFVVTKLDDTHNVALGIITRIIKQVI